MGCRRVLRRPSLPLRIAPNSPAVPYFGVTCPSQWPIPPLGGVRPCGFVPAGRLGLIDGRTADFRRPPALLAPRCRRSARVRAVRTPNQEDVRLNQPRRNAHWPEGPKTLPPPAPHPFRSGRGSAKTRPPSPPSPCGRSKRHERGRQPLKSY